MNAHGPSGYALERAMVELMQARERLLAIDPTMDSDDRLMADMLEGEAGDALAIVERLIEASIDADGLADMAKARKLEIAERQARFERRRDVLRLIAQSALDALGLKKLERPTWTASIGVRPAPLIVDEMQLTDEWFRTKREPLRAEIRKALAAGAEIAGAQLGNAATGITVRTR